MLRILDITAPDINNGNGIRVTLWVAGCTNKCKGCHTPWTWNYNQGRKFNEERLKIYEELDNWLSREYVEGITISGGDPLCQDIEGLKSILCIIDFVRECHPDKNIWLYTGKVIDNIIYKDNKSDIEKLQEQIIMNCDVIVDSPYIEELRDIAHCPFRGSKNQRIIYVKDIK